MSDLGKKNEAETSLIDRCGYCSRPKRPGKSTQNSHLCQCPSASDSKDPSMRLGTVPSSAFRSSTTSVPQATTVAETNIGLVEIVSVREKHGYFRKAIPQLPMSLAVLLCLLNVLVPGLGTLLSIVGVLCGCKTDYGCKRRSSLITLLAAFLQLLTAPLIVGWIWSVLWGITFVNISANRDEDAAPTNML